VLCSSGPVPPIKRTPESLSWTGAAGAASRRACFLEAVAGRDAGRGASYTDWEVELLGAVAEVPAPEVLGRCVSDRPAGGAFPTFK
jgi:hypothetical protein